jgi:ABC-type sugar transport system permease subunit
MPHRIFALFILPSMLAMVLFIAVPLVSLVVQSLYVAHPQVMIEQETCDPFGCKTETRVDVAAMQALNAAEPQGRFNGLGTYLDAAHLATTELDTIWSTAPDWRTGLGQTLNLPFYRALVFTLVYTAVVSPLSLALGLLIALSVNMLPRAARGGVIYITLLPMIVPSVIGALTLFWMIDQRGIIGAFLQWVTGDPTLSLKASGPLAWATLFVHGIWSNAPFVFIVFYAALQTVPRDTLEAAMVDGASRLERVRLVTLPHLRPVSTFLMLILVMDNFRVFEAIIGLSATAHASSLSSLIFFALRGDTPLFGSAAATSVLTVLCIFVLLTPSLRNAWAGFRTKT